MEWNSSLSLEQDNGLMVTKIYPFYPVNSCKITKSVKVEESYAVRSLKFHLCSNQQLYVIMVHSSVGVWQIKRRYSEFSALHVHVCFNEIP
jgi:hypothetical protein